MLLKIDDPSNAEVDVDGEHSNFAKFRIGSTREKNDLCVKLPVVVEVVGIDGIGGIDGIDGIDGGVILSGMILSVNFFCSWLQQSTVQFSIKPKTVVVLWTSSRVLPLLATTAC